MPTAAAGPEIGRGSEEAERFGAVADQQIHGLLMMIEHHPVRFTADARLLVAAERRVRGIGVVAIGPDAPRRDAAARAISQL
jgi:hypothetical protein